MESTGVYWNSIFYLLEDAVQYWLLNAEHLRHVRGKKRKPPKGIHTSDDYVEVVPRMRLSEGNRLWAEWLQSRGLQESAFRGDELAQEVGRARTGSFSIIRVRRSAVERLLPDEYGGKVVRLPPQAH